MSNEIKGNGVMKTTLASILLLTSLTANAGLILETDNNMEHYTEHSAWTTFRAYDYDKVFYFGFRQQFDLVEGQAAIWVRGQQYIPSTREHELTIHEGEGRIRAGQTYHFDGAGTNPDWWVYISGIDGRMRGVNPEPVDIHWSLGWREGRDLYTSVTKTITTRGFTKRQWVSAPGTAALMSLGLIGLWRARIKA